jgi:hypothetical protein
MVPEMYSAGDYTTAVDIYSFALIHYEVLVGKRVYPATMTLPILFAKVSQGDRPELPGGMELADGQIIKRGWPVDRHARDSFGSIFDALRRIEFKVRPGADTRRVAENLALVERPTTAGPMETIGGDESKRAVSGQGAEHRRPGDRIREGRRRSPRRCEYNGSRHLPPGAETTGRSICRTTAAAAACSTDNCATASENLATARAAETGKTVPFAGEDSEDNECFVLAEG